MENNIISKTQNGQIFRCSKRNAIHVEYKNLNFNFAEKQYNQFVKYINDLDGKQWEAINENSQFKRKIIIPTGNQSFRVLFSNEELNEFRQLLSAKTKQPSHYKNYQLMNLNFNIILN